MSDKLFTVAGYSTKDGKVKARFATDMTRIKTLVKTGHTDIQLYELAKPMTKVEALQFLHGKNISGTLASPSPRNWPSAPSARSPTS